MTEKMANEGSRSDAGLKLLIIYGKIMLNQSYPEAETKNRKPKTINFLTLEQDFVI
jgi:hypothetical protein